MYVFVIQIHSRPSPPSTLPCCNFKCRLSKYDRTAIATDPILVVIFRQLQHLPPTTPPLSLMFKSTRQTLVQVIPPRMRDLAATNLQARVLAQAPCLMTTSGDARFEGLSTMD